MRSKYFKWLYSLIRSSDYDSWNHKKLLKILYDTEFYSEVEDDKNRIEDAYDLRDNFYFYEAQAEDTLGRPSVFEVLVALARRIDDDIMWDENVGDRTAIWFWMMIENLGLLDETDDCFDRERVVDTLGQFLKRNYGRNGEYSLFPEKENLTNMSIWEQMGHYFVKNDVI